jgi:uncharacterized membrane protein
MQPKRGKYDTNPLDEQVARNADESMSGDATASLGPPTQQMGDGATKGIGRTRNEPPRHKPETEAPTRRMDDSYPSVFAYGNPRAATYQPPHPPMANIYQPPPMPPPQIYQPPPMPVTHSPTTHKVAGVNLPEKWANALPYFPFYIGLVASIVELLLVPRNEARTRFHAAQGFSLQIAFLLIGAVFSAISAITDSRIGSGLFGTAAFIFLIVSSIRVFQGKPHHISILDEATNWVNEKINRRK